MHFSVRPFNILSDLPTANPARIGEIRMDADTPPVMTRLRLCLGAYWYLVCSWKRVQDIFFKFKKEEPKHIQSKKWMADHKC